MSSRRPKRPSSARRNIKQETFSSFVSSSRLWHVQSILKGGSRAHASSPDAILCVTGIDSRYNDGCTELVNHLLFGFFENRRKELESSGFAEETIDDLLILVKHDSVHIYCNPVNYLYFLPYIAHWRNLKLHCLHPEKYDEDEEEAEEFKIHSFIAMVKDCKTIGIPYSTWAHPLPFDKFSIEKWPVIQAYALEGFGGGGFFTMKHEVVDVSKEVAELYSIMDPVSVEMLATEHLPLFERQWKTMLTTVDVEGKSGIAELTERKVCEPLRSYFSHGLVGAIKTDSFARYPFVLFGKNTNKKSLEAVRKGAVQSSDTIPSSEASHMVCQAVSPKGPLSCVRTYFFQASHKPYPVSTDLKVTPTPGPTDIRLLTKLYVFLVEGLLAAILTYANSLSVEKAQSHLMEIVKKRCDTSDTAVSATFISQRGNFEFSIEAYDHHGRPVVLKEGESSPLIKLATVYIYNIPSIEHNGQTLGSVGFAEAFLESTIPVVRPLVVDL
ncbi:uncharacterized protein C20orf194-like [Lingula anatina]|uniref:Uncharacterized protein C20orf194-like n=1 Tax=Lingula anatina TaxID=7574 RepID=A0A1S3HBX9_LINAN|nr:uncharacterized protein C20orf194-like [Lingula anatina]|eukprot:XP_013383021.1 uncharacterized protein C20orf194-like [Lingula anatina]